MFAATATVAVAEAAAVALITNSLVPCSLQLKESGMGLWQGHLAVHDFGSLLNEDQCSFDTADPFASARDSYQGATAMYLKLLALLSKSVDTPPCIPEAYPAVQERALRDATSWLTPAHVARPSHEGLEDRASMRDLFTSAYVFGPHGQATHTNALRDLQFMSSMGCACGRVPGVLSDGVRISVPEKLAGGIPDSIHERMPEHACSPCLRSK